MSITVADVIKAYVDTRNEIERIMKEAEEKVKPLREFQEKREAYLATKMTEEGETSKKTQFGTCFFQRTESVRVADWDAVWAHMCKTGDFSMLQHAVTKTAVLEQMGGKRDQPVPPGIEYTAIRKVMVRKA